MEFTVEAILKATPEQLYSAYLDSDEHSDMTGGEALITEDEDDKFTAWDGYIWGTNLKLRRYDYIKQKWRTSDFRDQQEYSLVEIFFEPQDAQHTLMRIRHSNLRDEDIHYKQGWVDNYFTPMKKYFEAS